MRPDGRKILKNYGTLIVRFVDNYDGDTFRVDCDQVHPLIGRCVPVRIADIDCPEMYKGTDESKALALKARARLLDILGSAKIIQLVGMARGKYFRIVAHVRADGVDVGDILIAEKFAVSRKDV